MNFLNPQKNTTTDFYNSLYLVPIICYSTIFFLLVSCTPPAPPDTNTPVKGALSSIDNPMVPSGSYEPAANCQNCHGTIFEQFSQSMHAQSFENPLVKAAFFKVLLPRREKSPALSSEVSACIACHAPLASVRTGGNPAPLKAEKQKKIPGVDCDLCHTITGYTGNSPGGGNFISTPDNQKQGPFHSKNDFHSTYSELISQSRFCAICHNRTNRYGLEMISTFSEWKKSKYAREGIQCQDCHMNIKGFLTAGKPDFASGKVAQGTLINPKKRDKLYTHRFPGAHSKTQVVGAIGLKLNADQFQLHAGHEMMIYVDVDNSRSGHKLPTGSAELRLLYLDLIATINGKSIHIPANSLNRDKFDVSGAGKFDAVVLGREIPPGSRLYRAVCVDPQGKQTLFSFDAKSIVFDNRLEASEVRREFYTFMVPKNAGKEFTLTARLHYLRYPAALADTLGIEPVKPVELAVVEQKINLAH